MKTYKGLKAPEIVKVEITPKERQYNLCKAVWDSDKCDVDCKGCIFDERNLKTFEQWEKEKGE